MYAAVAKLLRTRSHRPLGSAASTLVAGAVLSAALGGCVYDEGLIINNMYGTVVLPRAAATRTFVDEGGNTQEITSVANIGPVYIGVFPSVYGANVVAEYPHPEVGPVYQDGVQGDTYPYGGTTVGDLRFACFASLTCKVTSGRFTSYDEIVTWFNDTLGSPITNASGEQVTNGTYFQQTCFDLMEVTSDEEVHLLPSDGNGDDKIDAADLDFVENGDGDFEAEFVLRQQDFFWDRDVEEDEGCTPGLDCPGFSVWAFMDGPGRQTGSFATCNSNQFEGFEVEEYNYDFFGGRVMEDVLNQPAGYIGDGDWVADQYLDGGSWVDGAYQWNNVYDRPTVRLGYGVGVTQ